MNYRPALRRAVRLTRFGALFRRRLLMDRRYLAPRTLDDAVSAFAAAAGGARLLAGGTDLLVQMRAGVLQPALIIDIKNIAEMTAVVETADGGFPIGAAGSRAELA